MNAHLLSIVDSQKEQNEKDIDEETDNSLESTEIIIESAKSQETTEEVDEEIQVQDLTEISEKENLREDESKEEKAPKKEIIEDRKIQLIKIIQAIKVGKFDEIEEIIERNPSIVDEEDKEGNTALICAAREGNLKVVKYLIRQGADINHVNHENRTAIIFAAINGRVKAFKELVKQKDCNINWRDNEEKTVLLHIVTSIYENEGVRINLINTLLSRGDVKVNVSDKTGNTPLIYALKGGNIEIVKLLLEHNDMNVNHPNKKNCRALTVCLINEDFDAAWLLMDKGADIELEKERFQGKRIYEGLRICFHIMLELRKGNYDEALFLMKESVDITEFKGFRAKLIYEAIPFIFNALAYPRYVNLEGSTEHHTALVYSIRLGEYQIIERLLKRGANIDDVAILYAEKCQSKDIIELLNSYRKKQEK